MVVGNNVVGATVVYMLGDTVVDIDAMVFGNSYRHM